MTQGRFATMYTAPVKVTSKALMPRGRFVAGEPAAVGIGYVASMLMTPGAQQDELQRIDNDFQSLNAEFQNATRGINDPTPPPPTTADPALLLAYATAVAHRKANPILDLYHVAWLPLFQTWNAFYTENKGGSWWHNPIIDAETYQQQMIDVRNKATALGTKFVSPMPTVEHDKPGPIDGAMSFIKVAAYTALGIGGVFALAKIYEVAKK